jgi:hypothetical protein
MEITMSKRHFLTVPFSLLLVGSLLLATGGDAALAKGGQHHHRHRHAALVSIAVTPASPSIVAGTDQAFAATGSYSDATTADLTASVTWASSDPSATIDATGLAHGVSAGSSTISATSGAIVGSTVLTVTAPPTPPPPAVTLVSIAVTPASPSIVAGTDQAFAATGSYSDATTADLTASVTWASSDPSATIDATGLAHGVSAGSSTISATSGAIVGSTVLTVTAPPTPPPATVTVLGNVQAIFSNGDFLLTSGASTYLVVMRVDTTITNLLGHIVPSQFIAVGGAVEVTGPLTDATTIAAQLVVVQTLIDF